MSDVRTLLEHVRDQGQYRRGDQQFQCENSPLDDDLVDRIQN